MEQWTNSKLREEYAKAVYDHLVYLTYMQSTSHEMLGWKKHKLEPRVLGEISITTLMEESKEELESLLMRVKRSWRASSGEESGRGEWKRWLETHHSEKIVTSGPIPLRQTDGETMETVTDYFLGLQNHCRWWLQPWSWKMLAPWKKNYDQPRQHIKKQRHYFVEKGRSYGFSSSHVWM